MTETFRLIPLLAALISLDSPFKVSLALVGEKYRPFHKEAIRGRKGCERKWEGREWKWEGREWKWEGRKWKWEGREKSGTFLFEKLRALTVESVNFS
jgi:hypothetical protein